MNSAATPGLQRVRGLVEPVVTGAGLDLEELTITPAGRRRLVRVVVDADGGVSLDAVAEVSRALDAALDDGDAVPGGAYTLEVTSPGVDRPLTMPRHWRRAHDRLVRAVLRDGREVTGRVGTVDEDRVVLVADTGEVTVTHDEIARGHIQVEFRPRPVQTDAEEETT